MRYEVVVAELHPFIGAFEVINRAEIGSASHVLQVDIDFVFHREVEFGA